MNETKHKNLENIIKKADQVLATAERNEFGEWIGNEHLLYYWLKDIKEFINKYLSNDSANRKKINTILDNQLITPEDVKHLKEALKEMDKAR